MDIENLSTEELESFAKKVALEIAKRKEKRQNELWGNVRAAILKYLSEFKTITIENEFETVLLIGEYINISFDETGEITIIDK